MHRLSNKLQLACGELNFGQLHLQRWLLGPRWRGLHGVRGRKIQAVDGTSYVQRLSIKLHLVCGELNFDELHLQRGLLRPSWRDVHSMRGRKVQTYDRIPCLCQLHSRL